MGVPPDSPGEPTIARTRASRLPALVARALREPEKYNPPARVLPHRLRIRHDAHEEHVLQQRHVQRAFPEVMKALFRTRAQRKRMRRRASSATTGVLACESRGGGSQETVQQKKPDVAARRRWRSARMTPRTTAVSAVKNTAGKAAGKVADRASAAKVGVLKRFRPTISTPISSERILKSVTSRRPRRSSRSASRKGTRWSRRGSFSRMSRAGSIAWSSW